MTDRLDHCARKRSFEAVVDERTRVLILGSLPGEQSLAQARYYAHPRNQFWRLIGEVIGVDLVTLAYPERLQALLDAHIGLWDVIASAERLGSLDGNIRSAAANDLAELATRLPALAAIGFNGAKAAALGTKQVVSKHAAIQMLALPSSSPAYTAPFGQKLEQWRKLRSFL